MRKIIQLYVCLTLVFMLAPTMALSATVKGVISAKAVGAPAKINVTKDQAVCGKQALFLENLIVSKSGGLKNAVVMIQGAGKASPGKVSISQHHCRFEPHVVVAPAESSVTVKNQDGITHNFHSLGFENDTVNFSQPGEMKVKELKEGFEEPEVVKVQCDIHGWMNAWIVVTDSAATALTGADGSFTIANVKPGTYKVKVWHEKLGEVEKDITVKDGDNTFNLAMAK